MTNWFLCRAKDGVKTGKCTLRSYIHNNRFHTLFRWELLAAHEAHLPVLKGAKHSCWVCTCLHLWLEIEITLNSKGQTLFTVLYECTLELLNKAGLGWALHRSSKLLLLSTWRKDGPISSSVWSLATERLCYNGMSEI